MEGVTVYEGLASRSVFEQGFEAELGAWIFAAFAAFRKYRVLEGAPDFVHAHGRFLNAGAFALATKKSAGIPYIYTEHSSFYHRGLAPEASKPILKEIIEGAAVYSVVSPFLAETVEQYLASPVRQDPCIPNIADEIFEGEVPCAPPEEAHSCL